MPFVRAIHLEELDLSSLNAEKTAKHLPGDDLELVSLWFFATSKPVRIKTSHHLTGKSKIMDHLLEMASLQGR